LLGLAVFIEIFIESGGGALLTSYIFGFNDDDNITEGGNKAKESIQTILATDIYNWPEFYTAKGPLGIHSVHLRIQGRKGHIWLLEEREACF
jgi:hypothetical protein